MVDRVVQAQFDLLRVRSALGERITHAPGLVTTDQRVLHPPVFEGYCGMVVTGAAEFCLDGGPTCPVCLSSLRGGG